MIPEQYIPSASLRPFIKAFLFIESETKIENLILPDTSLVLAMRYRGTVSVSQNGINDRLSAAVFSGIRKSARVINYAHHTSNLLIVFEPGGAAAFLKEPLQELFGQHVPAAHLKGYTDLNDICEQLAALNNNIQRVACTEKVLLSKLFNPAPDPLTLLAVQKIQAAKGIIAIKDLSKELYISEDAFEKRFRQFIGTTPKHFSSIVRLRNAIQHHSTGKSGTHIALEAGYYDQAHFIKDFKTFTGQTPSVFFKSALFW